MNEVPTERLLTARASARARSLSERLQPELFESVLQYGLYAQVRLAGIADEVMSRLDLSADERCDYVRLLRRMGRLDPGRRRQHPLHQLLPKFRRGPTTEDALLDRYDRLCHGLDRMLPALESAGRRIGETLARFDILYARNQTYLEELDILVCGARIRLESLEWEVAVLRRDVAAPAGTRLDRVQQLESRAERVRQRIVDLQSAADTARDTGPTIRRIQDDLRRLLLDGQYTSLNTATRWKHRFAAAVTRARQIEARSALRDGGGERTGTDAAPHLYDGDASVATDPPATPPEPSSADEVFAAVEPATNGAGLRSRLGARLRAWRGALSRGRSARDVSVTDLWWG